MDNQIDNDIKNRIREVFENFEDPSADEGWLLLREKYPEQERRALVWLWWGAAAVLLLLIGIKFYNSTTIKKTDHLAYKTIKPGHPIVTALDRVKQGNAASPVQSDTASSTNIDESTAPNAHRDKNTGAIAAGNKTDLAVKKPSTVKTIMDNEDNAAIAQEPGKAADTVLLATSTTQPEKPLVSSPVVEKQTAEQNSVAVKPATTVYNNNANTTVKKPVDNTADKKVIFGVYGATFVNYASGGGAKVNTGAGFIADIPIGKNISLSTGVALAQNSFNYGSSLSFAPADPSNGSNPGGGGNGGGGGGNTAKASGNTASLISLDIPVNFKFGLNPSGNTFISTGLSSGTFITETYTSGTGQQTQIVDSKSFGNFYFARVFNFSFGTTLPLGKTNNLIIEPFIKYPLGGLGQQQIKFGSGGINLKFNLQPTKK